MGLGRRSRTKADGDPWMRHFQLDPLYLLKLPRIGHRIVAHLSEPDIGRCLRVSKRWNHFFESRVLGYDTVRAERRKMIGRQWLKSPIGLVRLSKAAGNANYMANVVDNMAKADDGGGERKAPRSEMVLLPSDMRAPMIIERGN